MELDSRRRNFVVKMRSHNLEELTAAMCTSIFVIWIRHHLWRLSDCMAIKNANIICTEHYRKWIYKPKCLPAWHHRHPTTLRGTYTEEIPRIQGWRRSQIHVFEDNKGCLEIATAPKMHPRTRYIAIKYHHFRSHVTRKTIHIKWVETTKQVADQFTKARPRDAFYCLRKAFMGW
jgi:hypothetical protein